VEVSGRRRGGWARCGVVTAVVAVALLVCGAAAGTASAETWTVDTTADPGNANCEVVEMCSLRAAVGAAEAYGGPGPAVVDATGVSGTIVLQGVIELSSDGASSISVEGPGAGRLTVDGSESTPLFRVDWSETAIPAALSISGMTLADGQGAGGAIVYSLHEDGSNPPNEPLRLQNIDFVNNSASSGDGGAISQAPNTTLTLIECTFEGNSASKGLIHGGYGGAIWSGGTLILRDTQVGTITQGNTATENGGGIEMSEAGSLTIEAGSTIAGNSAEGVGGGVDLSNGSTLTLDDSEVTGNLSEEGTGGGINGDGGDITIQNGAKVDDNTAAEAGGGIYSEGGTLALVGSSVEHNETGEGNGGGIYVTSPSAPTELNLESGSKVADNKAQGPESLGGGIFAGENTQLSLFESTFAGNSSSLSGGGIYAEGQSTDVRTSTISGNLAAGSGEGSPTGGGIDVTGGEFSLINSTVAGNAIEGTGSQGGGVGYDAGSSGASARIDNSTIARNSAAATSGGVLAAGTTEIVSTILAENSAPGCRDVGGAGLASGGSNIVGADECGFPATGGDQLDVDPGLAQLGDNGGPTETMAPTQADSPVINRGADPLELTRDQRGKLRPAPADFSRDTDVGAYEVQVPTNTTAPTISGSPVVGEELTCEPGSWDTDHVTATYAYRWTADGARVGTTSGYEVALADEGDQLICQVTAENGVEAVTAASPALTVPAPRLAVSPAGIDFGTEQSGTESAPLTITVSNTGGNPLSLGQVVLAGSGAGGFSLSDGCSGTIVAAGGACQVGVLFAPTVDGGYAATLEIPSTGGAGQVQLGGIGRTPTGALSVTPAALNFGTLQTGTVGPPATITISNTGDAALSVGQLALEGTGASAYTLLADGCSNTTIEPSHHCEAEVRFAPTEDGGFAASLVVPNSADDERVELSGIGRTPTGAITIAPASLDFGAQQTGTTSAPREVTVTNSGDALLTLGELGFTGPDASEFSLADGCSGTTLAPGEGCAVAVSFVPGAAGELRAALEIPSSVGPQAVPLAGVGQAPSSPPTNGGAPSGAGGGTGTGSPTPAGESADLRIHLSAPRRSIAGDKLTAELTITNLGPDAAQAIEVTARFGGVELGDLEIHGPHCRGGHKIECAIPTLAPGRRVNLEITATTRRPGTLRIAATARGVTRDGSAAIDRDRLTVTVAPRRRR
jgi:CSLREA domain-containing protein